MSRYIDADAMLEYLDLMYDKQDDKDEPYNIGVLGAINYIRHKAPSIDIVRCRECKHNYNKVLNHGKMQPRCDFTDRKLSEDDYCSRGEREGE